MRDITDIQIGSVLKWLKGGNPPTKDGKVKNSYFVFLGCFKDDNDWYAILFRLTTKVSFYIQGKRKNNKSIIFQNHSCFDKDSATSDLDVHVIDADRLHKSFLNGYLNKKCSITEDELTLLNSILLTGKAIPEILKEKLGAKEVIDWIEYLNKNNFYQ